ncbi:hypothetical protein [Aeromonas sobria]|uniref:hypothetical protein n=1 Tax=Aeromonas sobria TaxID=646 RepID=UPI003D04CA1B
MKVAIHDALPTPAKGRDGKVKREPFDIETGLHGGEEADPGRSGARRIARKTP